TSPPGGGENLEGSLGRPGGGRPELRLAGAIACADAATAGTGDFRMSEAGEKLTIDVVSDVVCPWCYLGEKRLAAAIAEGSEPVVVRWRPYQLDPTIPAGGLDRTEYLERKFGRDGRLKDIHAHLVRLGAEVGVPYHFDRITRAPNTLDAHRVIRWAASGGVQGEVVDRLFSAYF